jgi:hypothetical protein
MTNATTGVRRWMEDGSRFTSDYGVVKLIKSDMSTSRVKNGKVKQYLLMGSDVSLNEASTKPQN